MFKGRSNKKESLNNSKLFFDIRSGSVSVAYSTLGNKPSIIFSETKYLPSTREIGVIERESDVIKIVSNVAEHALSIILKRKLNIPNTIEVTYTSPWFGSFVESFISSNENSSTFELKDLDSEDIRVANTIRSTENIQNVPLEAFRLGIYLNGYKTLKPIGKVYRRKEFINYSSLTKRSFLEKVENSIQKHFSDRTIKHNTLPMIINKSFAKIKPGYTGCAVVIHGESTDICFFDKGVLYAHDNFKYGIHTALNKIMADSEISRDIHYLIGSKKVVSSKFTNHKMILKDSYSEWLTILLKNIAENAKPFKNISLISEDEVASMYAFSAILENTPNFKPEILNSRDLLNDLLNTNTFSISTHSLSAFSVFALSQK